MLVRVQVTYEFCIEAPDAASARTVFDAQHVLAISDDRCGVVGSVQMERVDSSDQFQESTLDEVPLGAFDDTLRERLAKGDI